MISSSALLRLGAWSYLPDFASRKILQLYYQAISSRGGAVPQPGTQQWIRHYRITYSFSVLAYLSYNLFEAMRSTPPNFFELLGVSPDVDDITLRSSYRTFAKRYHPDRAGPASEHMFVAVRSAYEALKSPVKRFAYERFGPDALSWPNCSTPMDYLKQGMMQSSGFYIVSGGILVVMSIVMKPSRVAFWRYILLLSLLACELCLTAGPRSFGLLGTLFPDRVAFQHVLFLHQLFVFLSVALSRVIPVLFPEEPTIRPEDPSTYGPWIRKLDMLEKVADAEVLRLLHLELHAVSYGTALDKQGTDDVTFDSVPPCKPPPDVLNALTREMEDILVEQFVRAEPPLRALWDQAVQREREQVADNARSGLPSLLDDDVRVQVDRQSRLPSPSPSSSPDVRRTGMLPHIEEDREESSLDEGCETPVGCLPSPGASPTELLNAANGLEFRTSNRTTHIRIVEQRRFVSPD